jgi:hypothetical protein
LRKALRILAILIGVLSFVTAVRFAFVPDRAGEHDDGSAGRGRDRGEALG